MTPLPGHPSRQPAPPLRRTGGLRLVLPVPAGGWAGGAGSWLMGRRQCCCCCCRRFGSGSDGSGSHFLFLRSPRTFSHGSFGGADSPHALLPSYPPPHPGSTAGSETHCGRRRTDQSEGSIGTDAASSGSSVCSCTVLCVCASSVRVWGVCACVRVCVCV